MRAPEPPPSRQPCAPSGEGGRAAGAAPGGRSGACAAPRGPPRAASRERRRRERGGRRRRRREGEGEEGEGCGARAGGERGAGQGSGVVRQAGRGSLRRCRPGAGPAPGYERGLSPPVPPLSPVPGRARSGGTRGWGCGGSAGQIRFSAHAAPSRLDAPQELGGFSLD